ncbi:unnamed protein product [Phytophthora fragariaefolia]|uniref:Unnamed protein product n=1 Tax=Phytophthora fragariaefolia TaxID=1490495 RepID=A0A9W6YM08_9STRA|nr:unnamed protein product [Phytophthora fragariaefolia]
MMKDLWASSCSRRECQSPEFELEEDQGGGGYSKKKVPSPPQPVGVILSRDGFVTDAALATELGLFDEYIRGDSDEEKSEVPSNSMGTPPPGPTQSQQADAAHTPKRKVAGRPKKKSSEPRATVTSPSRTPLQRNPAKVASDAAEVNANPKKSAISARLGAQDLRVFRDNIAKLTKRDLSETSTPDGDTSYTKKKRIRTARKLADLEKTLQAVEKQEASGRGGDAAAISSRGGEEGATR